MLARGRLSGHDLSRLVGSLTFVSLANRSSLAIFNAVYSFARARWEADPWPSVVRELRIWDGVGPLLLQSFRGGWSEGVMVSDASPWGRGAVQAKVPEAVVAATGRLRERWRPAAGPGPGAREQFFRAAAYVEGDDGFARFALEELFERRRAAGGEPRARPAPAASTDSR